MHPFLRFVLKICSIHFDECLFFRILFSSFRFFGGAKRRKQLERPWKDFFFYLSRANGVQSTPTHPKGGAPRTGRTCTVQCPWSLGEVARIRRSGGRATLTKFAPWRPHRTREVTQPPRQRPESYSANPVGNTFHNQHD